MDSIMHLMQEQRPMRATLETADGNVVTGMVYAANVNVRQDIRDVSIFGEGYTRRLATGMSWDIELRGTGPITYEVAQLAIDTRKKMSAIEWKCDYCASVNPRAAVKCPGCGASRSFVYG